MTTEQKKELWGEELFNAFANHIDENGWLTEDWAGILDKEMSCNFYLKKMKTAFSKLNKINDIQLSYLKNVF